MSAEKVLDKLGIKLPNSYIDRMFASEPLLIDDILLRVIKYIDGHPPTAPGFRPKRRAEHRPISFGQEASVSQMYTGRESVSIANLNNPETTYSRPESSIVPVYKSEESRVQASTKHRTVAMSIKALPRVATLQARQASGTSKSFKRSEPTNLPPIAASKRERAMQQRDQLVVDILQRDTVIEQLEAVLLAAQQEVIALEKLVSVKEKKMQLLVHRDDEVFRPVL